MFIKHGFFQIKLTKSITYEETMYIFFQGYKFILEAMQAVSVFISSLQSGCLLKQNDILVFVLFMVSPMVYFTNWGSEFKDYLFNC